MDAQLKEDLFTEFVHVAHLSGTQSTHADDLSPSPKIRVPAYIQRMSQLVITPRGEKVNSNIFIMLDADDFDIDEDEHSEGLFEFIWLPRTDKNNDEEARRPKVVSPCRGDKGLDHWEIFL